MFVWHSEKSYQVNELDFATHMSASVHRGVDQGMQVQTRWVETVDKPNDTKNLCLQTNLRARWVGWSWKTMCALTTRSSLLRWRSSSSRNVWTVSGIHRRSSGRRLGSSSQQLLPREAWKTGTNCFPASASTWIRKTTMFVRWVRPCSFGWYWSGGHVSEGILATFRWAAGTRLRHLMSGFVMSCGCRAGQHSSVRLCHKTIVSPQWTWSLSSVVSVIGALCKLCLLQKWIRKGQTWQCRFPSVWCSVCASGSVWSWATLQLLHSGKWKPFLEETVTPERRSLGGTRISVMVGQSWVIWWDIGHLAEQGTGGQCDGARYSFCRTDMCVLTSCPQH